GDVPQADLGDVPSTTNGAQEGENGAYSKTTFGAHADGKFDPSFTPLDPETGLPKIDIFDGKASAGLGAEIGVRGKAAAEADPGWAEARARAARRADPGASAGIKLNSDDGLQANAGASAAAVAEAKGDADVKTPEWHVDGVDKPFDAGLGVHGEAQAGA